MDFISPEITSGMIAACKDAFMAVSIAELPLVTFIRLVAIDEPKFTAITINAPDMQKPKKVFKYAEVTRLASPAPLARATVIHEKGSITSGFIIR